MAWKNMSTIAPRYAEADNVADVFKPALPLSTRITVAGAGAFGGWTALNLLGLGYKVTLFDPWGAGNSLSSSGGETRLMRSVYGSNSFYTKLANDSYDMWLETEAWEGRKLLQTTGNLWMVGENDNEMRSAVAQMDGLNLPYKIFKASEVPDRFSYINCSDLSHLILEEKAGVLKARESCQAVLEKFVSEGGQYVAEALKPGVVKNGKIGTCETSSGDRHETDIYLFAVGPWLKSLFPEVLGQNLAVTRQEVHYFGLPAAKASFFEANLPSWIDMSHDGGFYGIPGGFQRGFKVASDKRGREIDPTTQSRMPEQPEVERARDYVHHRFPGLGSLPLAESRVCQYTNTPDGSFILDTHPEASNVWLLGGGSGHGFKHGPGLGKMAASIIVGQQGLPTLLSLSRFKSSGLIV
ncbi:FAD-dependent oxidoreductase [Imperialibacter roseus]|uniref:FAD-dependent oxidoreductase n=1 Tax=Imperialibacter roseus TaxID=1324217 RepID=A0ABZ0IN76_9BACT|nr:FAD-dependent oxidoreductase [Imperialibacter roseus]WOK06497.1 FAD-dependent oxidoreductase [Imperialibacter roseus]